MSSSAALSSPPRVDTPIRKVAILFAGGPAPAANAVISTAAASFLRNDIQVLGILYGYSNLENFDPDQPLREGEHFVQLDAQFLRRTRNTQGVMIGTSRANPGRLIQHPDHFDDPQRTEPLRRVYDGLCSLGVDALVSIGGDDTLKTANKFKRFQERLPEGAKRIPVVHVPKTIDNDYHGIDFTFGYFTAVEFLASEIRNLIYDAEANRSYFIVETMGRSAGWLAYGAAIAGEASLVISVEDITGKYETTEEAPGPEEGTTVTRRIMHLENVVKRLVATIRVREDRENKHFGVIVVAEGLTELLPYEYIKGIGRDAHGHLRISSSDVNVGRILATLAAEEYQRQTGRKKRINAVQLGYESRCAKPHAFDVMLGSQLGVGAYRALVEEGRDGVMISVVGQLELIYVPFEELVDPRTLVTRVRYIEPQSDFHRLARFLETHVNE